MWPEVIGLETDWFVQVKCPRPDKKVRNQQEHIEACAGCAYAIWEDPQSVAGFMNPMCGVRVGSIGMAAELDTIAEKLIGVERFTKSDSDAAFKLGILKHIRAYGEMNGWRIQGFTKKATLEHLDELIEFCKKAESKGLRISAWA